MNDLFFNENNIKFIRNERIKCVNIQYKIHDKDLMHTRTILQDQQCLYARFIDEVCYIRPSYRSRETDLPIICASLVCKAQDAFSLYLMGSINWNIVDFINMR